MVMKMRCCVLHDYNLDLCLQLQLEFLYHDGRYYFELDLVSPVVSFCLLHNAKLLTSALCAFLLMLRFFVR